MTLNEGAGTTEYMIDLPLTTTDQFKVKSKLGNTEYWYPDGMDNNYGQHGEILADGDYTIYLRPNGDGGQDWFYNVLYVAQQEPSAIDNINADTNANAVKRILNGQLIIEKNGHTYNALGVELK